MYCINRTKYRKNVHRYCIVSNTDWTLWAELGIISRNGLSFNYFVQIQWRCTRHNNWKSYPTAYTLTTVVYLRPTYTVFSISSGGGNKYNKKNSQAYLDTGPLLHKLEAPTSHPTNEASPPTRVVAKHTSATVASEQQSTQVMFYSVCVGTPFISGQQDTLPTERVNHSHSFSS